MSRHLTYDEKVIDDVRRTSREDLGARMLERAMLQAPKSSKVAAADLVISEYTTAGRPAPSQDAPPLIRIKDPGEAEQLQMCMRRSTGVYEWVVVGIASI